MKRIVPLLAVLIVAMAGLARAEEPVHFPDANLKAAVEATLGISDPTPTNMFALTGLEAEDKGITDLTGLEYAKNLWKLILTHNQISDISALSGLANLEELRLWDNQISDISALSGLTNLRFLILSSNQISDISALSGLTNLQVLMLDRNQISDISALSGLTELGFLPLEGNQISDISALTGLTNLYGLFLHNNQISDISALSGLTNLEQLRLSDNQISDISALSGLTSLWWLYLDLNQISDISPLSGLTKLEKLWLRDNQINDISALSGLTNLTDLYLSENQLSDISALSGLTNLEQLSLALNQLSDISALSGLTNLQVLWLRSNQLSDISALSGLLNLLKLNLAENQIIDISALSDLANLIELYLHNNQISDISPISGLTNLTNLRLYDNQISDISPISGLTNLTNLRLYDNQISDISALSGLMNLNVLNLRSNSLNEDAYNIYIPLIRGNNPGISLYFDPYIDEYTISGMVTDDITGEPLEGSTVFLIDGSRSIKKFTYSDMDGYYCLQLSEDEVSQSQELYIKVLKDGYGYESGRLLEFDTEVNFSLTPANVLNVPYVSQGSTEWCLYASLSMILGYLEKESTPWGISDYFDAEPDQGGGVVDFFNISSQVRKFVSQKYNMSCASNTWSEPVWSRLKTYVESCIDNKLPVLLGIPGIQHAIVIVGYDNIGNIYISDPSGHLLIERLYCENLPDGLAGVKVLWDSFVNSVAGQTNLLTTAVISPDNSFSPPLTKLYMIDYISGIDDYYSNNVFFTNQYDPSNALHIKLDGKAPCFGHTYFPLVDRQDRDLLFDYTARSDDLLYLSVFVDNTNASVLENLQFKVDFYKVDLKITNGTLEKFESRPQVYDRRINLLKTRGRLEVEEENRSPLPVWSSGFGVFSELVFPISGLLKPVDEVALLGPNSLFGSFDLSILEEDGYYCMAIGLFDDGGNWIDTLELYFAFSN